MTTEALCTIEVNGQSWVTLAKRSPLVSNVKVN
jgi:hypothetical protein